MRHCKYQVIQCGKPADLHVSFLVYMCACVWCVCVFLSVMPVFILLHRCGTCCLSEEGTELEKADANSSTMWWAGPRKQDTLLHVSLSSLGEEEQRRLDKEPDRVPVPLCYVAPLAMHFKTKHVGRFQMPEDTRTRGGETMAGLVEKPRVSMFPWHAAEASRKWGEKDTERERVRVSDREKESVCVYPTERVGDIDREEEIEREEIERERESQRASPSHC